MKKLILLLLSVAMVILTQNMYAQTNYYPNDSGVISKDGYTYKYETSPGMIDIYNASTIYKGVEMKNRDGTKMSDGVAFGHVETINRASLTLQQVFNIVSSKFTAEQKSMLLNDDKLIIAVAVNTSTGRIADVYFSIYKKRNFMKIPVDVYRSIELALKSSLYFDINDEGRKLNYLLPNFAAEIE